MALPRSIPIPDPASFSAVIELPLYNSYIPSVTDSVEPYLLLDYAQIPYF